MKYVTLMVMTILAGAVALGGMGNQLGVYQHELESLRGQITALEAERGRLQIALTQLEAALAQLHQERDALLVRNRQLEDELAQLLLALETAQARSADLQHEVSRLRQAADQRARLLMWLKSAGPPSVGLSVLGMSAVTVAIAAAVRAKQRRAAVADPPEDETTVWVRMTRQQARDYARWLRRRSH